MRHVKIIIRSENQIDIQAFIMEILEKLLLLGYTTDEVLIAEAAYNRFSIHNDNIKVGIWDIQRHTFVH